MRTIDNSSIVSLDSRVIVLPCFPFNFQEDTVEYGIDLSGPVCLADDSERVVVPEVPSILNDTQVSLLLTRVNPLEQCDDFGKGFYIAARQIVRDIIM